MFAIIVTGWLAGEFGYLPLACRRPGAFRLQRGDAIGLGLSVEGLRSNLKTSFALAAVKLVVMPLIVCGLWAVLGLNPPYTVAAVTCAAVPTAKTVYVLAHEHRVEEKLIAATVSVTTMLSVTTLLVALYLLSGLVAGTR